MGPGRLRLPARRRRPRAQRRRQRPVRPPLGGHQPVVRVGRRPAAAHPLARDRAVRVPRQGPHHAPPRDPARPARHVRRHGAPRRHRAPARASASPPWSSCRCTTSSTTTTWSTRACATTGATTRSASSPRTATTRAWGVEQVVSEFKYMVKTMHEAGIEVILDVVYNHTAEGNHLGPTAVLQGHRQPRLLPARRRRPLLLRHHRHRQHAEHAPPARAAADHRLAALLGDRDARGRVPLRPSRQPGPPVPRGRPAVRVLRPHPGGPRGEPGQAHRRALGPRRRRLPGRQLPDAVVGVERPLPRYRPRLLARRTTARWPTSPTGSPAAPTCTAGPGAARTPASTSSPRTTGSPSPTWSPTTTSTTRRTARTTGTAPTTTARGTAAREGPTDDPEICVHPGAPPPRADDHAAAQPGRAHDQARRRDRPHPARQQQRLLPGQRDLLARLGARGRGLPRLLRRPRRVPAPAPGVPAAPLLRGRAHPRRRRCPTSAGSGRTARR